MTNRLQLKPNFISIIIFTLCLLMGRFLSYSFLGFPGLYYNLGIIFAWVLLIFYMSETKKMFFSIDIFLLLIFILISLISLLNEQLSEYSTQKIYEISFYILPLLLLSKYIFKTKKDFKYFFITSYYIALIFCVIAVILSLLNGSLLSGRLSAFGGGPITFSRILMLGLLSGIILYIDSYRKKSMSLWKFVYLLSLIFLAISIGLTGSRQSFLAMFLCLLLLGFFVYYLSSFKGKVKGFISFIMISMISILSIFIFFDDIIKNSTIYSRTKLIFQEDKGESINIRLEMLKTSFIHFKEKWYMGTGLGTFENYNNAGFLYPHNVLAEIAMEVGLLGVVCLCILICIPFFIVVSTLVFKKQNDIYIYGLFTIYIYFLITSMISGDFFDNRWIWITVSLVLIYRTRIIKKVNLYEG
ncbi:O-antigen ligase family protein [Lederbergia citrisecunda]|uniref:O-antigen ligase family protein n=1 Tax=Lederbergia citrisecunda TaxID=2833583 RepID=UPI003D2B9B52